MYTHIDCHVARFPFLYEKGFFERSDSDCTRTVPVPRDKISTAWCCMTASNVFQPRQIIFPCQTHYFIYEAHTTTLLAFIIIYEIFGFMIDLSLLNQDNPPSCISLLWLPFCDIKDWSSFSLSSINALE